MNKIGVIIPTYNEEENIGKLVESIKFFVPNSEIFVVDDSINDSTKKIFENKSFVHYFSRGKKLGRGTAVIFGLEKALEKGFIDIFVEMDADFSHKPEELKRNLDKFIKDDLDLLISSRYLKSSRIYKKTREK